MNSHVMPGQAQPTCGRALPDAVRRGRRFALGIRLFWD
jgi:hypothetical protein